MIQVHQAVAKVVKRKMKILADKIIAKITKLNKYKVINKIIRAKIVKEFKKSLSGLNKKN